MPVRLRLQRHGRRKRPFYHIVAADARAPRDGKFIEKLGTYNPMTKPATIELDRMAAYKWITKGAQPSDTVRAILRFKGVMYYKHLMRGVTKGALTQEDASQKWEAWIAAKEGNVEASRQKEAQRIADFHVAVSGVAPEIKAPEPEPVVEEAPVAKAAAAAPEATEEAAAPVAAAELTTPGDTPEEVAATEAAVAEAAAPEAAAEVVEEAAAAVEEVPEAAAEVAGEAIAEADAAKAAGDALEAASEETPEGASDVVKDA